MDPGGTAEEPVGVEEEAGGDADALGVADVAGVAGVEAGFAVGVAVVVVVAVVRWAAEPPLAAAEKSNGAKNDGDSGEANAAAASAEGNDDVARGVEAVFVLLRGVCGMAVGGAASGERTSERSSINPGRQAEMMMRATCWITVTFRRCIKRRYTAGS